MIHEDEIGRLLAHIHGLECKLMDLQCRVEELEQLEGSRLIGMETLTLANQAKLRQVQEEVKAVVEAVKSPAE